MKISRDDLHLLLKSASSGLGDSPMYPILSNFNIQKTGPKLIAKSTNINIYVFCSIKNPDFEKYEDFSILVDGKKLLGFLTTRKDKEFDFVIENNTLSIKSESISALFPLDAMDNMYPEFPPLSGLEKMGTLSRQRLIDGLSFIQTYLKEESSSSKETILEVRSSCVIGGSPSAMGVWKDNELGIDLKLGSIENKKIVSFLSSFFDDEVGIYSSSNHWFFKIGGSNFVSCEKLAEETKVPKIEGFMDKITPSVKLLFNKKELFAAVKSLKHTIDSTITEMRLRIGYSDCKKGLQVIFGNSSRNVSVSEVEASIDPESDETEISVRLDHKIFSEALKNYKEDQVRMEVYRTKSLAYFVEEDVENGSKAEIIMQVRDIT